MNEQTQRNQGTGNDRPMYHNRFGIPRRIVFQHTSKMSAQPSRHDRGNSGQRTLWIVHVGKTPSGTGCRSRLVVLVFAVGTCCCRICIRVIVRIGSTGGARAAHRQPCRHPLSQMILTKQQTIVITRSAALGSIVVTAVVARDGKRFVEQDSARWLQNAVQRNLGCIWIVAPL